MGCGSSKSTSVVAPMPMPEAWSATTKDGHQELAKVKGSCRRATSVITVKAVAENCNSTPADSQYSSSESITKPECRNGSAKSNDSGLGRERKSSIITEQSSPTLKELANVPETMAGADLIVDGKQMKTIGPLGHRKRNTGKLPPVHPGPHWLLKNPTGTIERADEPSLEAILEKHVQFADVLINELPVVSSIVKRPVSRGGVAFDINTNNRQLAASGTHVRKPACVLKYSQQRRAADAITHAELDEKQKAADQRRKVGIIVCRTLYRKLI